MAKGRKPDYKLKVFEKATGRATDAGAGWVNEDGSVSILLNPCVVLQQRDGLSFHLFVNDWKDKPGQDQPDGV